MRVDGGDERLRTVRLARHQQVAVGAGQHAEPAAQLVGAVAPQLASVALLERAPAAAALTELLGPGVELGDLGGMAGDERRRRLVDQGQQLVDGGRPRIARCRRGATGRPANASRRADERRIGGEDAGAGQVAAGRRDRGRDDVGGDAFGGQPGRHHVVGDGAEVDRARIADAMVTSSGGTKSASTRNVVDGGGSSIDFSSRAAASAVSRWKSCSTITLRAPSTGAREVSWTISRAWSAEIAGPARSTSWTSGCSAPSARRAARTLGVVDAGEEQGGEGPGGLVLGRAGRAEQQVGVHRRRRRRRQVGDRRRLPDDVVPDAGHVAAHSS